MTFKEVVDAVLRHRFDEVDRASAKDWVNLRGAELWSLENWTFRYGTDDVTITNGSMTVAGVASDFLTAIGLLRSDGTPLVPFSDYREFYATYFNNEAPTTGEPEAFTVIGGTILVGPTSSVDATDYKLIHEKKWTLLAADGDIPALPPEFHGLLVFGARAIGRKQAGDPTWPAEEDEVERGLASMRATYLTSIAGAAGQWGAYRP